jgi:RNA polymerase sigma-70 factor (ECF subfamily)
MAKTQTPRTDEELIRHVANGDDSALAELHRRHHAAAAAIAFRALRNRSLAEDAVQEAFLQLWKGAAAFDPARSKLGTWICVLAHRRAVDIARREARRELTPEQQLESLPPDSYTTEELVLLTEDRRDVQASLARISPPQRRVLELSYFGGMTQLEIATALGVPLGTVKSRAFDGLRAMKRLVSAPLQTELS